MKQFKVIVAPEAEEQIQRYLAYILFVFRREDAYEAVKKDYLNTLKRLRTEAGIIGESRFKQLRDRELKQIFFKSHDYVILFRVKGDVAEVAKIFHTSEDYQNKLH